MTMTTHNRTTLDAIRAIVTRHPRRLVTLAHARAALRAVDLLDRKASAAEGDTERRYRFAAATLLARVEDYCARSGCDPWCGFEHLRALTSA